MNVQKRYTHISPKFKIASTASLPYQPALSIQLDTFNFRFDKTKPSVADGVKVSQSKSRLYRSIDLDRDLLSPSHKPLEAIRICNIPTRELLLEPGSTGGDKSRVEFGRGFEKNSRSRIRLDGMNQTEGSINPSLLLSPTNKNFVSLITALEKRPEPLHQIRLQDPGLRPQRDFAGPPPLAQTHQATQTLPVPRRSLAKEARAVARCDGLAPLGGQADRLGVLQEIT